MSTSDGEKYPGRMTARNVFSRTDIRSSMRAAGSNFNIAGHKIIQAGCILKLSGLKAARQASVNISMTAHQFAERGSSLVRKISKHTIMEGYDQMEDDVNVNGERKSDDYQHIERSRKMKIEDLIEEDRHSEDEDEIVYEDDYIHHYEDDSISSTEQNGGGKSNNRKPHKLSSMTNKMKLPTIPNSTIADVEACFRKFRTGLNRLKSRRFRRRSECDENMGIVSGDSKALVARTKDRANMMLMHIISAVRNRRSKPES